MNLTAATLLIGTTMTLFSSWTFGSVYPNGPPTAEIFLTTP